MTARRGRSRLAAVVPEIVEELKVTAEVAHSKAIVLGFAARGDHDGGFERCPDADCVRRRALIAKAEGRS